MKVMVLVKASQGSEAGEMPSEELLTEMGRYNEELVKAGIMLAGEGLHPTSRGKRVRFSGKDRTVLDGPFAETKEQLAGFWLWKVSSVEEAVEWLKRCPNPMNEESEVEIRPVFEAADFGEAFTPELREQEASLRAQTLGLGPVRFETSDERHVVGKNASYSPEMRTQIPNQWEEFVKHLGQIPGQVGQVCYGVCWNAGADCSTFDYLAGVETSATGPVLEGFTAVDLPAGRYAVITHSGHVSKLPETIDTIWQQWVPDCGLVLKKSPTFERYTEEFDPHSGLGGMEVWIPISES